MVKPLHAIGEMGHGRSPCGVGPIPRPRPGDLLELLDALEPDQPDRRFFAGRRHRPHPAGPPAARSRPDPSDQARTTCPAAGHRPARTPPRPGAPPALVMLAPP